MCLLAVYIYFNSYENENTALSSFSKEKNLIHEDYEHCWKPTMGM